MGQRTDRLNRTGLLALLASLAFLLLAPQAGAIPFHPRKEARDVGGLNHACGAAVDSEGDLYASSAGESKIKVFDPSHVLLTEISDANTPCGLAVTTTGNLYVSEKATGEVVRFKPNAYPFVGTPTYGPREVIDASTKAKGIAVDRTDNRLYVAEGDHVSVYDSTGNLILLNEVQALSVKNATGGTFKLEFKEQKTAAILFNASAAEVKTELEALKTIGAGNVEVTSSYSVTFTGSLAHTDVPLLVADGSGLSGSGSQEVTVSETSKGFNGHIGEGTLTEATGVAAYTYSNGTIVDHYLWVADAAGGAADKLDLFTALGANPLLLRRELKGESTPSGSFGFGAAGASLAMDPGNRSAEGKCVSVGEQACSAGHLFLYDAAHEALDEFDASGEYLDQTKNAGFADAEPSGVAIERSGAASDGTVYVTAGSGAGAKAIAFGPLGAPSRAALGIPPSGLSHVLSKAQAVATDSQGDLYAGTSNEVKVYSPSGTLLTSFSDKSGPGSIAVDSTGKVYVLDFNAKNEEEFFVRLLTYYTPSKYPPEAGTTYTRHENLLSSEELPPQNRALSSIAVNPGPGPGKDQLFITSTNLTLRYDSAAHGSGLLDGNFAACLSTAGVNRGSLAVNGTTGVVYMGMNTGGIFAINAPGTECLARFDVKGSPSGKTFPNPYIAVDQSNGHVVEFDGGSVAREYDSAGSFVAQFGNFNEGLPLGYQVAVDNACAIHEPALTGEACKGYDPANGTAYVAYDNTSPGSFDVSAFGPLGYGSTPAKHKVSVERKGTGMGTVGGGSSEEPATIACGPTCSHEYPETALVKLEATPGENSEFKGWEGCENPLPTQSDCEVTPSADVTVKARFEAEAGIEYELTAKKTGAGEATLTSTPEGIDCALGCTEETAKFVEGSEVTVKAEVEQGSELLGWTGCEVQTVLVHEGTCTVKMDHAREVQVQLGVEHPELSVSRKGNGEGTVTSTTAGIDCGVTCSHKFDLGQVVTLKAQPAAGSLFGTWSGCDAEPSPSECEVLMGEARQVTAIFEALPAVTPEPALPILYTEATLNAQINPVGLETEYRFEYLSREAFEEQGGFEGPATHHTATEVLKAGEAPVPVSANLFGLNEGTEYLFRAVAKNAVGRLAGPSASFATQARRGAEDCPNALYRFGLSANLPDCRAYELVTPAQTDGLIPRAEASATSPSVGFSNWLTVQRGEGVGERLSYFTNGTLPGFEGNGVLDGYRSERGAGDHPLGGWQSSLFSPNYAQSAPGIHANAFQLGIASDQLYSAWEMNHEPETFPETLPHGVYLRTPSGFEVMGQGSLGEDLGALNRYVGPGGRAIFSSTADLEPNAAPAGTAAIYARQAGSASTEVVSTKPGGSAFGAGEAARYAGATEDGSAVAFSVGSTLYLHREGQTFAIASSGTFAGISEDGRRIFYTGASNGNSAGSLHACDTEAGPCTGSGAHAPTTIASSGIFALVSPDGTHAFFSSTEALTGAEENENGEEALPGAHNLYAWDGAVTRFIGRLGPSDFVKGSFSGISEMTLAAWTQAIGLSPQSGRAYAPTRSTDAGGVFAFQSHGRLTAYDNEGKGEIYRYDPAAEEGERLICVSCNPAGTAPGATALLEDVGDISPLRSTSMVANLTEDGNEVFFQSFDRLLPEDANEVEDVYEWKAKGVVGPGGEVCQRTLGCLSLISSGQGEVPSYLYAMSGDGHDVFFQTKEKLVGMDVAGSPSIYDARVGGGIPEPIEAAPCQGDACQGQGALPPKLPSPESGGAGGGNEAASESSTRPSCAKGKHRVKGRCVASKHKKRKRHRAAKANRGGSR
jgi:hypothetical protein